MNGVSLFIASEPDKDPFLVFGKPNIGPREMEAVVSVMRTGWLSTGQVVKDFEQEFEEFVGKVGYAVAVSSCTDGMILSLLASDVRPGDEVITTPLTFAATVNAILAVGAMPLFCDVDANGKIDFEEIKKVFKCRNNVKAIIPVHYTGSSPCMDSIVSFAKEHRLTVIEDAAHSFGGTYKGQAQGTHGDFGCFSFYATKNITCGEGGMVVCKTAHDAEKIRTMAMQGLSAGAYRRYGSGPIQRYEVSIPGRKSNLSDIHAAIGLTQLRRWPELSKIRSKVWEIYEKAFGFKGEGHSKHLFTISSVNRDGLRAYLHEQGIGTGIHFNPLHLEPAFEFLGYENGSFLKSEYIGRTTLSLPVSATMTADDAHRVVEAVKQYGKGGVSGI